MKSKLRILTNFFLVSLAVGCAEGENREENRRTESTQNKAETSEDKTDQMYAMLGSSFDGNFTDECSKEDFGEIVSSGMGESGAIQDEYDEMEGSLGEEGFYLDKSKKEVFKVVRNWIWSTCKKCNTDAAKKVRKLIDAAMARKNARQAVMDGLRSTLAKRQGELAEVREAIRKLNKQITNAQYDEPVDRDLIKSLNEQLESAMESASAINDAISSVQKSIKQIQGLLDQIQKEINDLLKQLQDCF